MSRPFLRAAAALLAISLWMTLLFAGVALGGAVHLLLAAALAVFPWRWLGADPAGREGHRESAP